MHGDNAGKLVTIICLFLLSYSVALAERPLGAGKINSAAGISPVRDMSDLPTSNDNEITTDGANAHGNFAVTSLDDQGAGTLREAIGLTNANIGPDTIVFDVSGTISLASALPALTDGGTVIRGSTAPGGARSVILNGQGTVSVGIDISSKNNAVRNLVLTNFDAYAVRISDDSNEVVGCHVNIDAAGTTRGTTGGGVEINGSAYNVVGGCSELQRNVIAGGGGNAGIKLTGPGADSNTIAGNYIGLAASGIDRLTNPIVTESGILLFMANGNTIGGGIDVCGNVVSGNMLGIQLNGSARNRILNNFIGPDASGMDSIPNEEGIALQAASVNNNIGDGSGGGNCISGNRQNGISFSGPGPDTNLVLGNYIGVDTTGRNPMGNRLNGVYLTSGPNQNFIGWGGFGNTISCNRQNGVLILGNSNHNYVMWNLIGLNQPGDSIGNEYSGISIDGSSKNTVNANLIAYNGRNGVEVLGPSSTGNYVDNVIFNNGRLGIDLGGDGVTVNDAGDGDTGPNELLNYPEIDSIVPALDGSFIVYGRVQPDARVNCYAAGQPNWPPRPPDPSGHGEAHVRFGECDADATGNFTLSFFPFIVEPAFSQITLTATTVILGEFLSTSEFSDNYILIPGPIMVVAYSPVNIIVTDPLDRQFGRDSLNNPITGIPDGEYYVTPNDSVVIRRPILGEYTVEFITEAGAPMGSTYSAIIKVDGTLQVTIVTGHDVPVSGQTDSYTFDVVEGYRYLNGDASRDGQVDLADAVYLINYVFKGGPAPEPVHAGDADCDLAVNLADAVYIINYVFKGGPVPCYFEP